MASSTRSTLSTVQFAVSISNHCTALRVGAAIKGLVHITGDTRFLRDYAPAGLFLNEVQGFMSEEDKARARAEACEVIVDYRDRGFYVTNDEGRLESICIRIDPAKWFAAFAITSASVLVPRKSASLVR